MALPRSTLIPSPPHYEKTHLPFSSNFFSQETSPPSVRSKISYSSKYRRSAGWSMSASPSKHSSPKLRILIAGGGIGGLVLALAARRKGFDAVVFEKDLSAIRGEGQYRGPIQIQSNALAALEAIDLDVAEELMAADCITGNRINGLVDGISGTWYVKFDTITPAVERGLPVTRVISRMKLQQILARAVGDDIILNGSNVIDFVDDGTRVTVTLENGQRCEGDLLVGADGIWSKVRKILFGHSEASYSGYTCYNGIADYVPPDIESVGYRVFLGHKQYFVSSDVGAGKTQWYAFHNEPAGGTDVPNGKKERLLKIFEGWCDKVIDLIHATDEDVVLRRDIYDLVPIFNWGKGRVTLLGDSVHAMQPYWVKVVAWPLSLKLEGRSLSCRLTDKASDMLQRWFEDDDAMERALSGEWYLIPRVSNENGDLRPIRLVKDDQRPSTFGSSSHAELPGMPIELPFPQVANNHARISCKDNTFYLTDLRSNHGTWLTENGGRRYRLPPNFPVRFHPSDIIEFGSDKKVMFQVKVLKTLPDAGTSEDKQVLQTA